MARPSGLILTHTRTPMRRLLAGLLDLVYPPACHVCLRSLPVGPGFCALCENTLSEDRHPTCPRCGSTVGPFVPLDSGCVHCRNESFAFDRVLRLGTYEGLLRDVVLRLKHVSSEGLAERMGELWACHAEGLLRSVKADVVIPVPLHWLRRLRRGYNQSESLAHGLCERLGWSCRPGWLRRIKRTGLQSQQPPSQRAENVRGAFQAVHTSRLAGRSVLLVDDVMTSGSTAHEAARALRAAGAARVVVAVLARARGGPPLPPPELPESMSR